MAKIGRKVGGVSLATMALAGIIKPFAERTISPVIGNGTLLSGAVKVGGGIAVNQFAGRGTVQDALSIALAVDGIEDIVHQFFGGGNQQPDVFGGAL